MKKLKRILSILLSAIVTLSVITVAPITVDAATSNNWCWPTSVHSIKSDWPNYASGKYHGGTDFSVPLNSPVYSTCDGEVVAVTSLTTSYGKHIKIKASVNGSTVYMRYCHLNSFAVSVGNKVSAGQLIAYSGSTGNSTGPHLHYEVRNANDTYGSSSNPNLNPKNYLPGSSYSFATNGNNPTLQNSIEFEALFYYTRYPDLQQSIGYNETALYNHWLNIGLKEGRCASPYFDVSYYLNYNDDIKATYGNDYLGAYNHYKTFISKEYRKLSPILDLSYYKANNSDLSSFTGEELLNHFKNLGVNELRRGSSQFDPNFYKNYYSDMSSCDNWYLYWHYCCLGISENRIGADDTSPNISDVKISNVNSTSYTVTCKVSDNTGVTSVKFPSWYSSFGTSNAIWYEGKVSNGIATCKIPIVELGNASGVYVTHIYAYDVVNNQASNSGIKVNIDAKEINEREPVDIGTNFYATISNYDDSKVLTVGASNVNVVSRSDTGADTQRWFFVRNDDTSYTIISKSNNNYLDVFGGNSSSGTNVQTNEPDNSNTQKWFIYINDDGGYWLRPACSTNCVLDLQNCSLEEGANIQIFTFNATEAQSFFIKEDIKIYDKTKADLGNEFTAIIENVGTKKVLTVNDDSNVISKTNEKSRFQIWKFKKNTDESYTIISKYNNMNLGLDNISGISGSNVQVCEQNNTNTQKWDLYSAGGNSYYLRPRCSENCVLNLTEYNTNEGTNIEINEFNSSTSQRFFINKLYYNGDINGDGVISIADATELQKHLVGLITLSEEQLAVADTNGDGSVSVADATQIQKYITQLIPSLG